MGRKTRKFGQREGGLNITSLMDMFTIILVFLLKSFAAEGQLMTQPENLRLPLSSSIKTPSEVSLTVIVDPDHILVDNQVVAYTAQVASQDSLIVQTMLANLEEKRKRETQMALFLDQEADQGKVIVQIDRFIPYDIMFKVMVTCGFAGYSNVSFAVQQKDEGL
jgi:biopolymer transport protein ExbD